MRVGIKPESGPSLETPKTAMLACCATAAMQARGRRVRHET